MWVRNSNLSETLNETKKDMNIYRNDIILTLAPFSTKYLTISSELFLIAIWSGKSLLLKEFHESLIKIKRNKMWWNNDGY